ncbi:leucine-rich repeat domain-containing protein [Peribacillus muralis]|uniref:leucine-rich repeat domain-containing protein n=1 Tax=Peribacillus muralis TaxID=264697 RepID=UPI00381B7251
MMFPIGEQPEFIKDINEVDTTLVEIAIQGKTKNLEKLEDFQHLEKVWLFKVNQAEFDLIFSFIRPKILYIYEMKVERLASIEQLSSTEQIHMCWNTKADKLWDLSKNAALKTLSIEDFKKLNSVYELQYNTAIESLRLSGGVWNTLSIDTLEPLKGMTRLNSLSLLNIRVRDESLEPLTQIKSLSNLTLSNQFPTEEYAKLSIALADTKCDYFQPYVVLDDTIDGKDIMVIGKRKPFLNSVADKKKLEKYTSQFKAFQEKFIRLS